MNEIFFGEKIMKKIFMLFVFLTIFSAGTYCDIYFMLGGDLGYVNMGGYGGFIFETFFDTQYYPFDGPIGLGMDLKLRLPVIRREYRAEYKKGNKILISELMKAESTCGVDFVVAPTLSLRLFHKNYNYNRDLHLYPVLKVFPVFAYSKHSNHYYLLDIKGQTHGSTRIAEPYIGYGGEICFNWTKSVDYPIVGGDLFLTYSYGWLIDTKEKYFSIGLGARVFLRRSLLDKRAVEKSKMELERMQAEYAAMQQRVREQKELEKQSAETAAIISGSLDEMINFINQYGDSKSVRLAIEQVLSGNENQSYKEFNGYENPYSFEKGSVYYCSSLNVHQWLSEHSFLAKVNGDVIYVETANIENVKNRISYAFLKANGVLEYNTAASSLNIVPRFTLMLFSK
ncbi:MAG: hypothetical protein K2H67_07130 [Treponemataceae bacterium]|nr:hypothetical protein [Treponemataceae bacterium]